MMIRKITHLLILCLSILAFGTVSASDTIPSIPLPDSVKVIGVMHSFIKKERNPYGWRTGIKAGILSFYYFSRGKKETLMVKAAGEGSFNKGTVGIGVKSSAHTLTWRPRQALPDSMTLYVASARDSASQIQLYSFYVYFPGQQKWKLLGTWNLPGRGQYMTDLAIESKAFGEAQTTGGNMMGSWYQNNRGAWMELRKPLQKMAPLMPFSNIDSVAQADRELKKLKKWPGHAAWQEKEGIYYELLDPGKGEEVKLTDTVTVHYKGYLLETGDVFDQTTDEPRTFPLNRLIKGWQIGVPLLKTGGKIKLVLPSGIAYSIRTRAAKIPPNSILVFEIEVVNRKPPTK